MHVYSYKSNIYHHKRHSVISHCGSKLHSFILLHVMLIVLSSSDAVTLTGSSEYAVPGTDFTLTCDVPEEANIVQFYRRPDVTTPVGSIQVAGDQCYNTKVSPAVPCTPDVCSCVTSGGLGRVFRWTIQPQTGDHGSVWYCRRTNLNVPDQTLDSADYTLNVADGPSTSIALSPPDTTYTRTEGDTLPDITCTADCRPGCNFVWTRPDNTNFTVSPVLSLGQLDRSEHGTYRCTARNVVGESIIITSVTVQYGPSTAGLTPPNVTYTPTEGQTIPIITCSADCNPVCTYSWTKDGQSYATGSRLQLTNIQRDQGGVYRCTASNEYGSAGGDDVRITVYYGPGTSIALSPPNTIYTRTEGDTLPNITCTADCRPGCTFVWTRPDNTNFTVSPVLSLGQLNRSEHGTYRCTARNVVGESIITTSVTVQYGPSTAGLTPPTVTYTPTEGQTIPTITCSADCNPVCTYSWTKDGQSYATGSRLQLTNIQRDQGGVYMCTASNEYGSAGGDDVRITVYFPPHISGLNFKSGDGNLIEGSSTSVICTVESFPASTIQWFYKANNTLLQTTTDVLESTYSLNNAACLDTGVYTCSVRNSVSNTAVTRSIHMNVLCKPREDFRVDYNHQISLGLTTSENLTVTALFLANPVPDFIWTFQNAPSAIRTDLVNGTDNFIIRNSFDGTNLSAVSIGIRKTMQEHWFGTYNVTATNSQGSGRISFIVEAKGKPNPPYEGAVICPDSDQAILSWRSAFDGGSTQTFVVGRRSQTQDKFVIDRKLDTPDPGQHRTVNISIPGLAAGTQYFFVVFAVNKFGNSTIEHKVSCTTQDSQTHSRTCGTDSMYVPGVVLTIIGVLSLLLTLGLEIVFRRNRKLCCSKCQFLKQNENEFQNVQLSERDRTLHRDNERSLYDQLDTNDVAKPSVYSELGGLHHAYQNDPVSDGGDSNRQYESLKGRAASNVYDEPHNLASGEKGTYVNTIIGGNKKH